MASFFYVALWDHANMIHVFLKSTLLDGEKLYKLKIEVEKKQKIIAFILKSIF